MTPTRASWVGTPDPDDEFQPLYMPDQSRTCDVYEADEQTFTGLLGPDGCEIHRSNRIRLGFRPD